MLLDDDILALVTKFARNAPTPAEMQAFLCEQWMLDRKNSQLQLQAHLRQLERHRKSTLLLTERLDELAILLERFFEQFLPQNLRHLRNQLPSHLHPFTPDEQSLASGRVHTYKLAYLRQLIDFLLLTVARLLTEKRSTTDDVRYVEATRLPNVDEDELEGAGGMEQGDEQKVTRERRAPDDAAVAKSSGAPKAGAMGKRIKAKPMRVTPELHHDSLQHFLAVITHSPSSSSTAVSPPLAAAAAVGEMEQHCMQHAPAVPNIIVSTSDADGEGDGDADADANPGANNATPMLAPVRTDSTSMPVAQFDFAHFLKAQPTEKELELERQRNRMTRQLRAQIKAAELGKVIAPTVDNGGVEVVSGVGRLSVNHVLFGAGPPEGAAAQDAWSRKVGLLKPLNEGAEGAGREKKLGMGERAHTKITVVSPNRKGLVILEQCERCKKFCSPKENNVLACRWHTTPPATVDNNLVYPCCGQPYMAPGCCAKPHALTGLATLA